MFSYVQLGHLHEIIFFKLIINQVLSCCVLLIIMYCANYFMLRIVHCTLDLFLYFLFAPSRPALPRNENSSVAEKRLLSLHATQINSTTHSLSSSF